jgi:hypothetical protein
VDLKKIEEMKDFPLPKTHKCLRGFLVLIDNYRKFIRNCVMIVDPFTTLLKKNISIGIMLYNEPSRT